MNTLRTSLRWTILSCLFIIPFLSLVVMGPIVLGTTVIPFLPSWFFPFITGKNFFFRMLVEVAVAAYAVLALMDKRYRPQFSWVGGTLAAFTVWMFIADCFAVNAHKALWSNYERMDGWVTLIHLLGLFVVAVAVLSVEQKWDWWWKAYLAGVTLVCLDGLMQLLHLTAIHQGSTRVDATLGNSEYLAGYLLFGIAIAGWQILRAHGKKQLVWRWGLGVLIALQFLILYTTQTRGTIIGIVAAVLLGAILLAINTRGKLRMLAVAGLVLLALSTAGFYTVRNAAFVQHDGTLARLASVFDPGQYATRGTLYHMAIEGALAKPITGWGQEGFNYVFNKYYEPSLYGQEQWFDRAHNVYFDWLVAGGFPALLLFLALLGAAFYGIYRSKLSIYERILLASVLTGYAVQGLTVFDNLFTYVPLMLVLAYIATQTARPIEKVEAYPELEGENASAIALPIAAVALVAVLWFVNMQGMIAASDMIAALTPTADATGNLAAFTKTINDNTFASQEVAEQLVQFSQQSLNQPSISNDTKSGLLTLAQKQMAAELTRAPQDARLHLENATLYRAAGDSATSATELEKAHTLSPKKQSIIVAQGIDALQSGKGAQAKAYFDAAYALSPNFADLAIYKASGEISAGNIAGGKQILMKAFGTTTEPQSILIYAYFTAHDYLDLITLLEAELRGDPTNTTAAYQLAEMYATVGRVAEAKALVQKTVAAYPNTASVGAQIMTSMLGGK